LSPQGLEPQYYSNFNSIPVHIMVTHEGVDVLLHLFLTSALDEGELPALRSGRFTNIDSPTTK